jgi:hypothetical protein
MVVSPRWAGALWCEMSPASIDVSFLNGVFESLDLVLAFIKRLLTQLRHAAFVKRQAFFAVGISQMRGPSAKSEQPLANYGERDARSGQKKQYEDTNNMEPVPGD